MPRLAPRSALFLFPLVVALAHCAAGPDAPDDGETASPAAASGSYSFRDSALDGAGFQNVVAFSPFKDATGARPALLGADIAGIHRSLDGGKSWMPSNVGLPDKHIASLMFSSVTPGRVYAATNSAIAVSTDFGQTWSRKAASVKFDANGTYFVNPGQEHPRPTGNLLAQDESGATKYLYAATATGGVKRSSDDAASWDAVALDGHHLRSLALDPSDSDRLYVADAHVGLQVSNNAHGAMTFTKVPGSPSIPEELAFVDGKLYVAANTAGIFMYDGAWHALNKGLATTSAWESITGYVEGGKVVLIAGCADPVHGENTVRSTDGGATWESLSSGPGVTLSPTEYGQTTRWWAAGNGYLSFTGNAFVNAMTAVNPDDHDSLLIAGRGGAKHGQINGSSVAWAPSVHGLMVTVNMMAVADPHLSGRVYVGSMDYTFLASHDNAATIAGAGPSGAPSTGDFIALDPDGAAGRPSTVYLAASKRGQNTGVAGLWSNPDPIATPADWTDEKIPVENDILAVGVGHDAQKHRVLLASITNKGLFRKVANSWAQVTGTTPFASGTYGKFVFVPGTPTVYAIDEGGVWRSTSAGATGSWTKLTSASAAYSNVDAIALDPVDTTTIYVSSASVGGVLRITGANGARPVKSVIYKTGNPGPIAVTATGALIAHDRGTAKLMRSVDPRTATPSFASVGDAFFAKDDGGIRSLAVGPDGFIFTASNSAGMSVGVPTP